MDSRCPCWTGAGAGAVLGRGRMAADNTLSDLVIAEAHFLLAAKMCSMFFLSYISSPILAPAAWLRRVLGRAADRGLVGTTPGIAGYSRENDSHLAVCIMSKFLMLKTLTMSLMDKYTITFFFSKVRHDR